MNFEIALRDYERLTRAADGMIANYGKDALAVAERRATTMRLEGCDEAAATWGCICKIIRAHLGVAALIGGASALSSTESEMSQRVTSNFSFFEIA